MEYGALFDLHGYLIRQVSGSLVKIIGVISNLEIFSKISKIFFEKVLDFTNSI